MGAFVEMVLERERKNHPLGWFLFGEDVDDFLAEDASVVAGFAFLAESDCARAHRKKSVVLADPNVLAGFYLGSALADDNHPWTG